MYTFTSIHAVIVLENVRYCQFAKAIAFDSMCVWRDTEESFLHCNPPVFCTVSCIEIKSFHPCFHLQLWRPFWRCQWVAAFSDSTLKDQMWYVSGYSSIHAKYSPILLYVGWTYLWMHSNSPHTSWVILTVWFSFSTPYTIIYIIFIFIWLQ